MRIEKKVLDEKGRRQKGSTPPIVLYFTGVGVVLRLSGTERSED